MFDGIGKGRSASRPADRDTRGLVVLPVPGWQKRPLAAALIHHAQL